MADTYTVTGTDGNVRIQATLDAAAIVYAFFRDPTTQNILYVANSTPDPSASVSTQADTTCDINLQVIAGDYSIELVKVLSTDPAPALNYTEKGSGLLVSGTTASTAYVYIILKDQSNNIVKVHKAGPAKTFNEYVPISKPGTYILEYLATSEIPVYAWFSSTSGSVGQQFSQTYSDTLDITSLLSLKQTAGVLADAAFTPYTVVTNDNTLKYIFVDSSLDSTGATLASAHDIYALNDSDNSTAWTKTLTTDDFQIFSLEEGLFYIHAPVTNTPATGDRTMSLVKIDTTDGSDAWSITVGTVPSGTTPGTDIMLHAYYFRPGAIILCATVAGGYFFVDLNTKAVVNMSTTVPSDITSIT